MGILGSVVNLDTDLYEDSFLFSETPQIFIKKNNI